MGAPVPQPFTARVPSGIKLKDGSIKCVYIFSAAPTVGLFEIAVTPPGLDGGPSIDQTTQFNTSYVTRAPQVLKDLTEGSFTAAYDPQIFSDLNSIINVETVVTVYFFDGSSLAFYGYLQKVTPGPQEKGKMPTVTVTVTPTNFDYVAHVEASPVLTSVVNT
jgi:hypothetical protein